MTATSPSASFIGPNYYHEQVGPILFEPFAQELLQDAELGARGRVLEIACGTGVLTRLLRARLPSEVDLVATDLSPAMLSYARESLAGQAGITWQQVDAQDLPFEDGGFSAVLCAFGFMFVPDRLKALREARRVLAPGASLAFSVWDRIENNPHALANARVLEGLFPSDPDMKFRTPYELGDDDLLRELLAAAGFTQVQIETRRRELSGIDPAVLASGQIRGTPRSVLLLERGASLERVIDDVAAALARQGGRPYSGFAQAKLVRAR